MRNSVLFTTLLLLLFSFNHSFAQFQYIYPINGGRNEFPDTHIILRNGSTMDESSVTADKITLSGSVSGIVAANVVLSTDKKTVCVTPSVPFAYGENVTVNVNDGLKTLSGQVLAGTSFSFSIRRESTPQEQQQLQQYISTHDDEGNLLNDPNQQATYVPFNNTDRTNNLGFINIYTNTNPYPWNIFFHRNSATLPQGYGIMTNSGDSVFFRHTNIDGSNFQINANGYLTAYRLDPGVDTEVIVLDSSYNIIDQVHCKNGLRASQHEHIFLPDGTKWFTIYDWQNGWDLSQYGGGQSSTVNVSWIQELDANDNVIYQWRSDQHFQLTDAAPDIFATITQNFYDPWHINSMFKDNDGNFIISFRNMDLIIKLNPTANNIMWYWGSNSNPNESYNEFTISNDPNGGFSHQHHVHRIDNGHILMFDNGNLHNPAESQPKEYTLDETNMTSSLVWYYKHPQVNGFNMFTKQQGDAIRLPNGNTFIGYGLPNIQGLPNGTEIDANKNIVWEFRFKDSTEYSYRVYKFDWSSNVGIAEIDASHHLDVFPNPSNGIITLNADVPITGKITLSVLNVLGQTVYTKTENNAADIRNESLDLTALCKGVYLLQVSAGEKKLVGRILIQ